MGLFLLIAAFVTGYIGAAIGAPKNRAGVGFVLGFFLSILGMIVIAVISGDPEPEPRTDQARFCSRDEEVP